ncbi:MAG: hypothetical protein VZR24_10680 [Butyrivibrio hungatei]|nr:hypothetical protein [Butyrivibrio hungatei]
MDSQKKNVMIGIDIFLWIFVIIPWMIWGYELFDAYKNGNYFGSGFFGERSFYIGWDAVKMQYEVIMSWGGYIWIRYLLLTLAYTIFIVVKIKKANCTSNS